MSDLELRIQKLFGADTLECLKNLQGKNVKTISGPVPNIIGKTGWVGGYGIVRRKEGDRAAVSTLIDGVYYALEPKDLQIIKAE